MRTGLILAGGNASRFGSPKPLARFRGRPMVRWVADVLASQTDELLLSVRGPEQGDPFRAVVPEARAVPDLRYDRGPIEGFARGFEAARGDVVLVAPCDAPLLTPALYRLLLRRLGDCEAAVPCVSATDPLRAVYRADAVRRGLSERTPDCPSALVDGLRTTILEADELRHADPSLASFIDVNREADLRHALDAASGRRASGAAEGVKSPSGASLHTVGT